MRGKPPAVDTVAIPFRIIPAHAGQTTLTPSTSVPTTDHPRACGANRAKVTNATVRVGSSPRMRGKLSGHRQGLSSQRIIPAHAGQTMPTLISASMSSDHPRACGANSSVPPPVPLAVGSSPRMRGKPTVGVMVYAHTRIIPAHAGQTAAGESATKPRTDHPRACGANRNQVAGLHSLDGSSPRMRGKRAQYHTSGARRRIIPAHAGQTECRRLTVLSVSDHPRACGANGVTAGRLEGRNGSSPRMRGKLTRLHRICTYRRIIPAHAGQTGHDMPFGMLWPDHPRACGANSPILCENS